MGKPVGRMHSDEMQSGTGKRTRRGGTICSRSEVIEMRLPERSYLCCVSDDLSPVCHQGKHKPAEFHYHKETFTLTEYLQTVSSLCVFQGSFICHSTNTELHNEMKVVVPECYTKFRG